MITAIATVAIIVCVSILCGTAGYDVWRKMHIASGAHIGFTFGAAFFTGMTLFLVLFGMLQYVLGVRAGLASALVILIAMSAWHFPWATVWSRHRRTIGVFSLWCLLFFALDTVHALKPLPRVVLDTVHAPFAYGFGDVVHSFRAENIMMPIVTENAFPFINQNSTQSILASVPVLFGADAPQWSLIVWHALVVAIASIFVWGCARSLLPFRQAIIPTILVLLGNTALSYRYISVTDTSHALLQSQNYETVIGLVGLTLGTLIIRSLILEGVTAARLTALFVLSLSWSVVGAHLLLILVAIGLYLALIHRARLSKNTLGASLSVLFAGMTVGTVLLGGMFALGVPPRADLPGAKSVMQKGVKPVELRRFRTVEAEFHATLKMAYIAEMMRGHSAEDVQTQGNPGNLDISPYTVTTPAHTTLLSKFRETIVHLKENVWVWRGISFARSLQLVFFSLVGIGIGYWLRVRTKHNLPAWFSEMYRVTLPLFFGGWVISSVFFIYGQYGEVSRFFAPGVTLSLFLLGSALVLLMQHIKNNIRAVRLGVGIVLGVAVLPVLVDYVGLGLVGNFVLPTVDYMQYDLLGVGAPTTHDDVLSVRERLDLLMSPGVIRGAEAH